MLPTMADHALPSGAPIALGRYRLLRRLGTGVTATVWHARDEWRGRDVALKLLHPHLATDSRARARLDAEASAARRLRQPAVVQLLEAHLDPEQPALVFEYHAGETLASRLNRTGRLVPGAAAEIARSLADGLAHLHGHRLVHRDVKPSNVLLPDDGGVRLLDLGTSAAAGRSSQGDGRLAVGTLAYMAPEQLAGGPPDPANDMYALGVMLYEMLTGNVPFRGAGPLEMAWAQTSLPPPVVDAPPPLARLAISAMALDATARPTAAAMARALRELTP
jgi:serine/threonine-protein kinase